MILYHGSFIEINKPDLKHSRPNVDFGKGFYTTPIYEQAVKWCSKFKKRGKNGIVTRYEFDENDYKALKILKFDSYSEEWLDFILMCRKSSDTPHDFDVVIGPTADDDTSLCLNMYSEGVYGSVGSEEAKQTLLRNLEVENLGTQVFIGTKKGLSILCNKRRVDI